MELMQIKWKNEKQKLLVIELLKELQVNFRTLTTKDKDYELYGEGFKESILNGKTVYDNGDTNQFVKIEKNNLWK